MAQSTTASDPDAFPRQEDFGSDDDTFDIRDEQITHLQRVLDLQIEGSRLIYDDALRLFFVNVIALGIVVATAAIAAAMSRIGIAASDQISAVLVTFGTIGLFVSMAFSIKAYLGDVANYGKLVSAEDEESFKDQYLNRQFKVVKQNATVMERTVDAVRNGLLAFVVGMAALVLGVGFQVVAIDTWAQMALTIGSFLLIGYLINNVMGLGYLQRGKNRFVR